MYTWILVFLLCSWKIETLILKLKDQKLQTMFYNLWARAKIQVSDPGSWYASCLIAIAKKLGEKIYMKLLLTGEKILLYCF